MINEVDADGKQTLNSHEWVYIYVYTAVTGKVVLQKRKSVGNNTQWLYVW